MTKLTRRTRDPQVCIELLRQARIEFEKRPPAYSEGICSAIARAEPIVSLRLSGSYDLGSPAARNGVYLRGYIEKQLGSSAYLGTWLIKRLKTCGLMDVESLRKARLQWIDWMIEQLEAEPTKPT
ncbi:MAG: hypothetical protein E6Q97_36990 [Desulfurellales bacterium]|nr:MAG: hypothetical protein E6Q97_36990 [Desulfurellales bacterium]